MRPLGVCTMYAPICWVMPPNSISATLALRIASKVFVLPWSTCPIIVTTGGRGAIASSVSSSVAITVSSYKLTTFTSQLYSEAKSVAVSESMDCVMETIIPIDINLAIISDAFKFIFFAKSETETVSIISIFSGTALAFTTCFFLRLNNLSSKSSSRSLRE